MRHLQRFVVGSVGFWCVLQVVDLLVQYQALRTVIYIIVGGAASYVSGFVIVGAANNYRHKGDNDE